MKPLTYESRKLQVEILALEISFPDKRRNAPIVVFRRRSVVMTFKPTAHG